MTKFGGLHPSVAEWQDIVAMETDGKTRYIELTSRSSFIPAGKSTVTTSKYSI